MPHDALCAPSASPPLPPRLDPPRLAPPDQRRPTRPTPHAIALVGIVVAVALFRKEQLTCTDDVTAAEMISVVIVSAIALVLALLLSLVVLHERRGKPLFMPLLSETTVEAVKPQL